MFLSCRAEKPKLKRWATRPKRFNQHWFVDGKQVQLVVGKDSQGNLIKTWEVHVVINKQGDRPVYSAVP